MIQLRPYQSAAITGEVEHDAVVLAVGETGAAADHLDDRSCFDAAVPDLWLRIPAAQAGPVTHGLDQRHPVEPDPRRMGERYPSLLPPPPEARQSAKPA